MSLSRTYHNVALVGFMGTGKSTVGYFLAEALQFELIDTDRVIEQRTGRRIANIFAQDGEDAFRKLESDIVLELESRKGIVISTGGGMIMDPQNLASLQKHALVACLWAAPETIFQRVKGQSHRPLLMKSDPLVTIRELLAQRAPVYRKADLMVGVDFRQAPDIARHIAKSLKDAGRRHPNH